MDDGAEHDALARLRSLAYSRDGTADDRARLARAEARVEAQAQATARLPRQPEPGALAASSTTPGVDTEPPTGPAAQRRRRPVVLALLLAAAVAVGWTGAWLVFQVTRPSSSLQVFERPETSGDSPETVRAMGRLGLGGGTQFGEVRLVGIVDEGRVYAAQGVDVDSVGETSGAICLALVGNGETGSSSASRIGHFACTSLRRFLISGVKVASYAHSGSAWEWGPTGEGVRLDR